MVIKCVCSDILFSEMKKVAEKHSISNPDKLREYVTFGVNCKLCLPYVKKMLETGETEFEPIIE